MAVHLTSSDCLRRVLRTAVYPGQWMGLMVMRCGMLAVKRVGMLAVRVRKMKMETVTHCMAVGHSLFSGVHCTKLLDLLRFTCNVHFSCLDIRSHKTASVLTVRLTYDKFVLCYYQGHDMSTSLYHGTAQRAVY